VGIAVADPARGAPARADDPHRHGSRTRAARGTPEGSSAGRGDGYLIALNRAIADFGSPVYLRFLAEMNNPANLYSPTDASGRPRGPSHSAAAYRQAFRRAYVILHGGDADARLRSLGQAPVGRRLPANTPERLTVIWNPIAGMDFGTRRPGQQFYPGDRFVDMVGNDIYASSPGVASYAANEALTARIRRSRTRSRNGAQASTTRVS
jgi:hypothetical protein